MNVSPWGPHGVVGCLVGDLCEPLCLATGEQGFGTGAVSGVSPSWSLHPGANGAGSCFCSPFRWWLLPILRVLGTVPSASQDPHWWTCRGAAGTMAWLRAAPCCFPKRCSKTKGSVWSGGFPGPMRLPFWFGRGGTRLSVPWYLRLTRDPLRVAE